MKLTIPLKLMPTQEQAHALLQTLERANAACNAVGSYAWQHQTFGPFKLQKAVYHDVRARYLHGIPKRVTARRRQRARLVNWSLHQLRSFIEYKAKLAGVAVILVDPRNTSRTCPQCGRVDKRNRPSQSEFRCTRCGYSALADWCAAREIRARAVVNRPMVAAGVLGKDLSSASYKPLA